MKQKARPDPSCWAVNLCQINKLKMNARFLLILSCVLALCSCGGGKEDEDEKATGRAVTSCVPDRQTFEAIPLGTSYEAVTAQFGCPGYKWREEGSQAQQNLLQQYFWYKDNAPSNIGLNFKLNKLVKKSRIAYVHDACGATLAGYGNVTLESTIEQAFNVVGCRGELTDSDLINGEVNDSYNFISSSIQMYVYARNGRVYGKSMWLHLSEASSCTPTLENTRRLTNGMNLEQATAVLQCPGLKISERIISGEKTYAQYFWGKYGGPNITLTFDGGYLANRSVGNY